MIIVGLLQCGGNEKIEGRKQAEKWLDVNYNAYKGTKSTVLGDVTINLETWVVTWLHH